MTTDDKQRQLRKLEEDYEYETDEELKRKRFVYRSIIVKGTKDEIEKKAADLELCKAADTVLSKIVRERERARLRRETGKEIIMWVGAFTPFVLGLLARPWIDGFFKSLLDT